MIIVRLSSSSATPSHRPCRVVDRGMCRLPQPGTHSRANQLATLLCARGARRRSYFPFNYRGRRTAAPARRPARQADEDPIARRSGTDDRRRARVILRPPAAVVPPGVPRTYRAHAIRGPCRQIRHDPVNRSASSFHHAKVVLVAGLNVVPADDGVSGCRKPVR